MIGVAGCGRMGGPMLSALRASGFDAVGFDTAQTGIVGCSTELLPFKDQTRTLISVVRDIDQTDQLLFSDQRMIDAPNLSSIIICSTLSPNYVRGLRAKVPSHITLIDAPMSGAQIAAQQARLSFMLGGAPADLDTAQPLFEAMGCISHRMGPFGSGMQAKVLNNLLAASNVAMTRLVLEWADNTDLDEAALRALIHTSSGQNWFASGYEEIEFARDGHDTDNTIGILVKDVESALDSAPPNANTELAKIIQQQILRLKPRR